MAATVDSVIAAKLRDRAREMQSAATEYDAIASDFRALDTLLGQAADRLAKGEALDGGVIFASAAPLDASGGMIMTKPLKDVLKDEIADLRRILGLDGAALANAIRKLP